MSRPDFTANEPLDKRYELALLFDVQNGNPNGDPDADNAPRVDPETGNGLITDVCIKRKIRNYVGLTRGFAPPHNIYVKERGILANVQREAYQALGIEPDGQSIDKARRYMCQNYFDVRSFGAVMTTGKAESEADAAANAGRKSKGKAKLWNCGQVRGPVQFGFGSSIDPVMSIAHTITRVALTNATDAGQQAVTGEDGEDRAGSGQIGRKYGIPYGLYRMHGFISPYLAEDTGFTKADMGVLLEALEHLFDHDHSASRGEMSVRGLFLFEHELKLGNASAHKVLETVKVGSVKAARHFSDYEPHITAPEDGSQPIPGVTCWRYV
ncbi:MAG TPA: type I-C CRISPR-associated protein Cas7/Csd2 [Bryobacteraceae bacterium]